MIVINDDNYICGLLTEEVSYVVVLWVINGKFKIFLECSIMLFQAKKKTRISSNIVQVEIYLHELTTISNIV